MRRYLIALVRLAALYLACLGIVAVAGAIGSELYMFPLKRHPRPPTDGWTIAIFLVLPAIVLPISRQVALYLFTGCMVCVLVGTFIGWAAFSWSPSWAQHLLGGTMVVTAAYAWDLWWEDTRV